MVSPGRSSNRQRALRPASIRDANCDLVVSLLQRHGAQTRAELARASSLTPQALGSILGELVTDGLVRSHESATNGPGRPSAVYEVDPGAGYWLGISVQWRSVLLGLADASGNIRRHGWLPHEGGPATEILAAAATEARSLVDSVDGAADRLCAVGLSVLGQVDTSSGTVGETIVWPEAEISAGVELSAMTGWPTRLDSAARATARAEVVRGDTGRGLVAVLYFTHDPYLILVDDGTVVEGRHGMSGELAHLPVPGATNRCTCGRVGCMATVASGSFLVNRYRRESGLAARAAPDVIEAAREGSEAAKAALEEFSQITAQTSAMLLSYLDPSLLVISGLAGGPTSRGANHLLDQIRAELAGTKQADLELVISPLGRDAHIWGALTLAHQERGLRADLAPAAAG